MTIDGKSSGGSAPSQPFNISGMPEPAANDPVISKHTEAPTRVASPRLDDKVGDYHTILDLLAQVRVRAPRTCT